MGGKIKDDQSLLFILDHKCYGWNHEIDDVALNLRFQTAARPRNETAECLLASRELIGGWFCG